MKSIHIWLDEYGVSHQNTTNKLIHWICVPAIFFSITGLLYSVKLPLIVFGIPFTLAHIIILLVIGYYVMLSSTLSVGMTIFCILCLFVCNVIESIGLKLWIVSLILFIVAWIGQFIGHKIEGKKPSFFKDIQFLMIGPAWLMSFVYKKIGIKI